MATLPPPLYRTPFMAIGGFLILLSFWVLVLPTNVLYPHPLDHPIPMSLVGLFLIIVHCKIIDYTMDQEKPDEDADQQQQPPRDCGAPCVYLDPLYHAL